MYSGGRDRHPVLVVLDLAWNADLHDGLSFRFRGTVAPSGTDACRDESPEGARYRLMVRLGLTAGHRFPETTCDPRLVA
ncbi:hypothetical protein Aru02nite_48430 [Actinocatenispora rupis]|uniref:Uncharacterized protein n=1 Tax=Actinocatenispora rupis TaxID=519421 RepID=A0A8J3NC29_9ACTN|nr:hypothetical protein Aru02nite_48430 [Actinocatenispora rupis]